MHQKDRRSDAYCTPCVFLVAVKALGSFPLPVVLVLSSFQVVSIELPELAGKMRSLWSLMMGMWSFGSLAFPWAPSHVLVSVTSSGCLWLPFYTESMRD